MLDDLKMIHQRDAQDALGVAEKQGQQLVNEYDIDLSGLNKSLIENIIVGGMGGSALAALMYTSWPKAKVPFEIVKNYELPDFAGEKTLFIASSYSGNTEETLEALNRAEEKECQIVVVAAGGELVKRAQEKGYPLFKLPEGKQPRMAVFYNFTALVQLHDAIYSDDRFAELKEASSWLGEEAQKLLPTVATSKNSAKKLALELVGSSVVIYSGPLLMPAAYKWKININENAKTVAWYNTLPEFNHNEFLGWTSHPVEKPYKIVDLRSNLEHKKVQKRFEVTERLLSGRRPAPEVVQAEGDTMLKQLLWTIQLGDFVSLYLALLNGLNPTPVDLIEKLKLSLKET
jgi:glucose/mannose-6-phosphate isomerase